MEHVTDLFLIGWRSEHSYLWRRWLDLSKQIQFSGQIDDVTAFEVVGCLEHQFDRK